MLDMRIVKLIFMVLVVTQLTACGGSSRSSYAPGTSGSVPKQSGTFKVGKPYQVFGKWYRPQESYNLIETGIASWYGPNFHGKPTANGERFDQNELTAAHRTLHMPSIVRVTNLENGRSIVVRVNDRGPFKRGRIIDLSKRAAELLGYKNNGTAKVRVQVLPEESKKVASLAKQGLSTRGMEVAMNNKTPQRAPTPLTRAAKVPIQTAAKAPTQAPTRLASTSVTAGATGTGAAVQRVERVKLDEAGEITGHTVDGNFYPDPVVKVVPVAPTGIYVQAASFASKDNAMNYARQLAKVSQTKVIPAQVNGQLMHRVRFGPLENVEQADILLAKLVNRGDNGIIVVE